MKFFDDSSKNLKWYNRNYFCIVTLLIIAVNILLYYIYGYDFNNHIGDYHIWYNNLDFSNLIRGFLNGFEHANWQHVLLNMLCFLFCGLYIERKEGSLKFAFLMSSFAFISGAFCALASLNLNFHGASGIVYMCYAYIIIDFIFVLFQKEKRTKANVIWGSIFIFLIYVAMCFNGGTLTFGFEFYPYDLMNNAGHYYSFFCSVLISLMINIYQIRGKSLK